MYKRPSTSASIVVLVILMLALSVSVTSAVQHAPESSGEIPPEALVQQRAPVNQVIGDDPDEDGYAGPAVTAPGEAPAPSGAGPALGANIPQRVAPQPDEAGYAAAPDAWSTFYYVYAAGSTLKPRDDIQRWNASGDGGCTYVTSAASEVLNLHLDLPTGAQVEFLRIFFYDTSASDSRAWLTTYDGAGNLTDVYTVASTGTAGYGTALSTQVFHIVDNLNNAYVLNWRPNTTGSTMRLCGLRVAYRVPVP